LKIIIIFHYSVLDRSSAHLKSWNLEPSEKGVLKKKLHLDTL